MSHKRKDLLALPVRNWQTPTSYDILCIVPTGKREVNGYHLIALVGENKGVPVEIAAYCDAIIWFGAMDSLRMEMLHPSRITRVWGRDLRFKVGHALSTTDVTIEHSVWGIPDCYRGSINTPKITFRKAL